MRKICPFRDDFCCESRCMFYDSSYTTEEKCLILRLIKKVL